jgi:hypothetical protein
MEIKATDINCNPITGSGYINYISGWINGQPSANLDLRTLTDPNNLNLGNITGKVQVKYTIKDACGNISTRTYPIMISAAPPANIVLEIYNKNNPQVYLPPSHNHLSPVGVGTSSIGFRVNNSTGAITFYTVKIDEVYSNGNYMQEIYNVTKAINGASGLTYEGLNSECVRDIVWPAPPGFGNCTNTNPAYNGYTGYFIKGDGQYSYLHYYKLSVTIGNPCNQSSDYSYLYVNSQGNKADLATDDFLTDQELVENSLSVYPNPASDVVTFVIKNSIDEYYSLVISDMYGRKVKQPLNNEFLPSGTQTRAFNIADLPPGMYTYCLISPSFTSKGRFLKQ